MRNLSDAEKAEVQEKLKAQRQQQTEKIIQNVSEGSDETDVHAAGRKNMIYGALWCIGGIVVTVVTYSIASGGGTYIIAWGAIVFGAIQFFRGLIQSSGEQVAPKRLKKEWNCPECQKNNPNTTFMCQHCDYKLRY